jgi:UDPglucose--hexose-1-phosphate uridylyltransferase
MEQYVIIAPKRNKRPQGVVKKIEVAKAPCFLCPSDVDDPAKHKAVYELKGQDQKWLVKSILNDFPALSEDNLKAYGHQEVIVETPLHGIEIHELPLEHIVKVFDSYIDRYLAAQTMKGICYTILFKNEGGKAGASILHSHSQLIAMPMVPPKIEAEAAAVDGYIRKNNSCPYCDIIKSEKNGPRVAWEDEHLFVLAPYASESPYGLWFIPKRHLHSIEYLHENEKLSFAHAFKKLLAKLDDIDMPYNYFFQNSLDCEEHHMILKLAPRPNVWAGLELGTGVVINSVPPEDAVKFYKE